MTDIDLLKIIKKGESSVDEKVISNDELRRMLQNSQHLFADKDTIKNTTLADINIDLYKKYLKSTGKDAEQLEKQGIDIKTQLINQKFMEGDNLTLAGLLFFSNYPQKYKPVFTIKCVYWDGNTTAINSFRDKEEITGNMQELFKNSLSFIKRNLKRIQPAGQGVNAIGRLEIPEEALEELLANALVHRDYYLASPIRIFLFDNRLEIISPGKLPNSLTIENIKNKTSIARNPIIYSKINHILPFMGVGSGIDRVLTLCENRVEFDNDTKLEQFTVTIKR